MERVGVVLRDLEGGDTLLRRLAQARALERWPEIVGPHLAGLTRALRVADGRLVVLAPGAALRQELTFHKRTILRKFNEAVGHRDARDVVFLESDSLGWESASIPVRPAVRREPSRSDRDRRPADDADDADDADETGSDPEPRSDPVVVPEFDAEEYRQRLSEIEGSRKSESRETG